MATEQKDSTEPSREEAIREFERDKRLSRRSVLATGGNRTVTAAFVCLGVVAVGGIFALQHFFGGTRSATPRFSLARREQVPKLNLSSGPSGRPASAVMATPTAPAITHHTDLDALDQQNDLLRAQQAAQARMQAEKLREARLKSAIIAVNVAHTSAAANGSSAGGAGFGNSSSGPTDANSRFSDAVTGGSIPVSTDHSISDPQCWILRGKLIDATRAERIDSDLPGTISAIVSRDVYGAIGDVPLLPAGTMVTGVYNAQIAKGQTRIFTVWQRLVTPAPHMVKIDVDSPGADQLGTVGSPGSVDNHFLQIFGNSALISLIGAGTATGGVSGTAQANSAASYREGVQQAMSQAAQTAMQPYLHIQPTIISAPGQAIEILVNRDLHFTKNCHPRATASHRDGVTFIE